MNENSIGVLGKDEILIDNETDPLVEEKTLDSNHVSVNVNHWEDVHLSNKVLREGYPNVYGAQIPINTHLNLERFEQLIEGYQDQEVINFLKYGWPCNRVPGAPPPTINNKNHVSATKFPKFVQNYLDKETSLGATIGPFATIPFHQGVGISPLSTRPKKDCEERRAILDLSFPEGSAVNDWTDKDSYLGIPIKLSFPSVDDLARRMKQLGQSCRMFKRDIRRAYRNFGVDPADYRVFGYIWAGFYYFDKVLVMGSKSSPYVCQRVTSAIKYIHCKIGLFLLNYVDDFLGAEMAEVANMAYERLGNILAELNIEENTAKAVSPCEVIEFLGVTFNSEKGTMEISPHRLSEILKLLDAWKSKTCFSRKQLESLIGKLQFVAACVRPGRIFISRLLNVLRETPSHGSVPIQQQMMKDIEWWKVFMPLYNGVSVAWLEQSLTPDETASCDASGTGMGAYLTDKEFVIVRTPREWRGVNIAYMEMWGVILILKAWGQRLAGLRFTVECDNMSVVEVLSHGRAKDLFLQAGMREVAYLLAVHRCELRIIYVNTSRNKVADWLSRWTCAEAKRKFREFSRNRSLRRITVNDPFTFTHTW